MARPKAKKSGTKTKAKNRRLFMPYPLLVFLLLCCGVFLLAWTFNVGADDILVNAKVKGPPVGSPAAITTPTAGSRFTNARITVSGSCPANAAYVEIFRSNIMSGSAICGADSTFSLQIDLLPGQNDLMAQAFNVTDDAGPASATVTVFYDNAAPPAAGISNPVPGKGGSVVPFKNPLLLKTAFIYKGYYIGQKVVWPLEISGGTAPYAVKVDWGDGQNDVISRPAEGQFDISHQYREPGAGYQGSFDIKVDISDAAGDHSFLQFFALINLAPASHGVGSIFSKPPPSLGGRSHWLWVAWPAYVLVILMIFSYWLGEREELIILRKRGHLRR